MQAKSAIVGLGLTEMGKIYGRSAVDFAAEAIALAVEDAGLTKDDLDGLLVNANSGFDNIGPRVQMALGLEDMTLVNVMKQRAAAPEVLVDLADLDELRTIGFSSDGMLEIGAMVTCAHLQSSSEVEVARPILGEVAGTIADVQVRNPVLDPPEGGQGVGVSEGEDHEGEFHPGHRKHERNDPRRQLPAGQLNHDERGRENEDDKREHRPRERPEDRPSTVRAEAEYRPARFLVEPSDCRRTEQRGR